MCPNREYHLIINLLIALDSSLSEPRPGSADVVQTYEDLVRHYVSNALNIAVTHATETELTKRVREWEERIKPRLLAEVGVACI